MTDATSPPRLAVLIAAPWRGEEAMHHDLHAMWAAVRARGFRPEEIISLEGRLDRARMLEFLGWAAATVRDWREGELFLYYSGHGAYHPWDAVSPAAARPAVCPELDTLDAPERWVFWDEVFAALPRREGVRLTLLPDA